MIPLKNLPINRTTTSRQLCWQVSEGPPGKAVLKSHHSSLATAGLGPACARPRRLPGRWAGTYAVARHCLRAILTLILFAAFPWVRFAAAQQTSPAAPDYTKDPEWFPSVLKPYRLQKIPEPDFSNTPAVSQMVRDGKLQLSVSQFVTAVMENNLDIAGARYNRFFSQTDVLRAKAGGAPRGSPGVSIPSGLFAGAIGAGLGTTNAFFGTGGSAITGTARAVNLSPRGSYDPAFTLDFSLDHASSPLNSLRVAGEPTVTTSVASWQTRYEQAFTSGTTFSVNFNAERQGSDQRFLRFNPAISPSFSFTVTQQLLNGFGFAVNRRYLEVSNNGRQIAREVYRQQVVTTLVQAQNSYWDLVAFRETVRAAEQALQVAQQLYENNKKQAEVGTLARLDVVAAESEVASRQRDLIVAQTNLQQAEVQIKNLLSKQMDSSLAAIPIETTDPLPDPQDSDIAKLEDALAEAQRNRPEIPQAQGNILNEEAAIRFSENSLKPTFTLFGQYRSTALYGDQFLAGTAGSPVALVPGGFAQALSQILHFHFPEYAVGFSLTIPIKNRSAQADNFRARLEQRQAETSLQSTRNQITLEVRNAVIGLVQAKAQVEAARQAVEFEKQTMAAEQKKLAAGVSTPYNVILVQRDLLSAQLAEVQARATYAKARVEMDRSTGSTLDKNHIDPQEVPRAAFGTGLSSNSGHSLKRFVSHLVPRVRQKATPASSTNGD